MAITANVGSNNWNTNGAWVGGIQPDATSDVIIPATAVVTIPIGITALGRSCTISASGTLAFAGGSAALTLGDGTAGAGNVAFSNAGTITLTGLGTINFVSTSATVQTVTSGLVAMPNMTFNGVAGSWSFSDNMTVTGGTVTLTNGTLNTNGKTCAWGAFSSNNTNTRTLTLGASAITVNAGSAWLCSTVTNLTMGANTAVITLSGAAAICNHGSAAGTVGYFNDLRFTGSGAATFTCASAVTITALTRTGTAAKTDSFVFGGSNTVGTFTVNGNSVTNRVLVASSVIGTARTITAATVTCTNADFRDITGAGAGSWNLSAITGNSGDCGGNSGITFTTGGTETATGTASFTWSTHGWTTRVPLPQDTAAIPNAFVAGRTVTMDMPRYGPITYAGCTGTPAVTLSAAGEFYGHVTFAASMGALTLTGAPTFQGVATQNLTMAGNSLAGAGAIVVSRSKLSMVDALTTTSAISTSGAGYIDTQSFAMTCLTLTLANTSNTNLFGTSTVTATQTTAVTVLTFVASRTSAASATFVISVLSANTRTVALAAQSIGTLTYTVAGSTGQLTITGGGTIGTINFSDATNARTLAQTSSTTLTVTTFNVNGTSGKLMTYNAVTPGTFATLSVASGTVSCDYLSIQDNHATGGATFYAGANSTSVSGNTGWIFTAAPTVGGGAGNNIAAIYRRRKESEQQAKPLPATTQIIDASPRVWHDDDEILLLLELL
jgi:hypothetical protein